ncbi:putative Carboxylesterase [Cutaneotrichosporon oleaginosum]|uniref:S-formylglutathione hydrolase n=1 Tax=Cutaneotrichosporon oleaginosum TaxID=879819 RepID=A0A0J0XTA7_9TREE|nr:putative Carboxylesterase [Cutaneotrichosporon oleaginosum]KLT44328.1 putative Carboxylesterase [Cutaneotrichosporon oleaginosum]TXT07944.1 hypothetical protein COLE_04868 [Cutaneotrichosporon oleaginosum]
MSLEKVSANRVANGVLTKYKFPSSALGLETSVNVYVPDGAEASPVPVLFYLAGLTCTEDTGAQKGGMFNSAGKHRIALVFPDTSPRGAGVEGEDDDWQLGTGAGFYINATNPKWKHYNMYDLIAKELPEVLGAASLGLDFSRFSITGHSMGGHGALTIYLKDPARFRSCSAFAPICNPSRVPWGQGAFGAYLLTRTRSSPPAEWLPHDASHLLAQSDAEKLNILVDVGTADQFLTAGQLTPEALEQAYEERKKKGRSDDFDLRRQEGYDHSYYFISTFSPEHVDFHAKYLNA